MSGVSYPRLGAGDDVIVTLPHRPGTHGSRIGAGVCFGQAVGAEQIAAEQIGKPGLFLVTGAGVEQSETRQGVHAGPDANAGPRRADLFQNLEVALVGLGASAVLLGVRQAEQPRPPERQEDVTRECTGPLGVIPPGLHLLAGDFADQVDEIGCFRGGHESLDRHWNPPEPLLAIAGLYWE